MNPVYLFSVLFLCVNVHAIKTNHRISRPSKSIFSNKKYTESILPARYKVGKLRMLCDDNSRESIKPEQCFPDVEYPTSIMEATKPYYFKNDCNSFLKPFPNDVKETFETLHNKTSLQLINSKIANDYTLFNKPQVLNAFLNKKCEPFVVEKNDTKNETTADTVDDSVNKTNDVESDNSIMSSSSSESEESEEINEGDEFIDDNIKDVIINNEETENESETEIENNNINVITTNVEITDIVINEYSKENSESMEKEIGQTAQNTEGSNEDSYLNAEDDNSTVTYDSVKSQAKENAQKIMTLSPLKKLKRRRLLEKQCKVPF